MSAEAPGRVSARIWYEAARPKTLAAGFVPVLVGTAAADRFVAWRFAAAVVASVGTQVATNYANDYFDGVRGVDSPSRVGPRRATASGLVRPRQMLAAVAAAIGVASVAGIALSLAVGPEIIAVGLAAFAAALAYSGGPRPYGAAGLGEVMVFVFFGLVATVGSAYVQDARIVGEAVAASVPVGMLASAILVANNLRDIPTDAAAGKRTLAVRIGPRGTRALYVFLVGGAFGAAAVMALSSPRPHLYWPVAVVSLAAIQPMRLVLTRTDAPGLIEALVATARLQLGFGLVVAWALWRS